MATDPIFAYAQINARVQPIDRGNRYHDPLETALSANGWASVSGGGTLLGENGEIAHCGLDLDLMDVERAVPFICEVLTKCGAPKGSELQYSIDEKEYTQPFGSLVGLAIYLNGTDLPDEVYANSDIDHLTSEINRLLDTDGEIQGYWQGPTETALYLYGSSIEKMKSKISGLMAEYPLCQKARYEVIT